MGAYETPAKTTRTVPLEFKDEATGEHFDVVEDDDLRVGPPGAGGPNAVRRCRLTGFLRAVRLPPPA
jgi:hypothetical protein